jgi:hypothetical protein
MHRFSTVIHRLSTEILKKDYSHGLKPKPVKGFSQFFSGDKLRRMKFGIIVGKSVILW